MSEAVEEPLAPAEWNDDEEEIPPPLWVQAIQSKWYTVKSFVKRTIKRRWAVRQFLKAVKEGDTTEALTVLAMNPFLLAYGTFAQDGDTVWHLLAEFGDVDLLQALINFCKIHPPKRGRSRMSKKEGTTQSDISILQLVNVGNDLNQTPLMFAAYHGRDDVIVFLLKQGADPWAYDRCGRRTAIHYACMKGYADCVNALLENIGEEDAERDGCKYVNVKSASGFTPLHFAVAANCLPAVRSLLAYDAKIDDFNMFDAGEFWISCPTKSTALHIAATSNRLHCAMAILQFFTENKKRLQLEDPRCWCDKKGRTPQEVAQFKRQTDLALLLEPGSKIEPLSYAVLGAQGSHVLKLQTIAAKAVKSYLLSTITEAEEYMKLLGTRQTHGRVFARLAYDSQLTSQQRSSTSSSMLDSQQGGPPLYDPYAPPSPAASPSMHAQDSLRDTVSARSTISTVKEEEPSQMGDFKNTSKLSEKAAKEKLTSKRQATIKQWLNYERKADPMRFNGNRQIPLRERSLLSQLNPHDAEIGCFSGCMANVGLHAKPVYLPPNPGEDVCGMCQDNKPLLQINYCGHRTCILCAKSLCYMLDLNQLALCPFCGSLVSSFGLA
ncbi:hypothetical protein CEUSTIGMA_g12015.t1 [Chlamydomonas eustigma]|uniref:Uncharacterized protein n=1 Tax=Chlamydomonas eustigma TaxID=1157962 RepID=A0A250XND1_9CHLO|nr:hypothetical protein CEUSTIGMA_g12015.t1 [Chlamydomonas eustigma]|eukprot:GAX84594.1 hypothetical protein CEUSTIGMA_g12015.t1 [Chlamydomonas eustigma]